VSYMINSLISRGVWFLALTALVYLVYKTGGFNNESIAKISKTLDTRGGNIIILVCFTMLFFTVGIGFGYHILGMIEAKGLSADNTMAALLVQFVTGSAFGTALGALIQLLGGSKDNNG
jgi:hypothetical protein